MDDRSHLGRELHQLGTVDAVRLHPAIWRSSYQTHPAGPSPTPAILRVGRAGHQTGTSRCHRHARAESIDVAPWVRDLCVATDRRRAFDTHGQASPHDRLSYTGSPG